MIFFYSNKTLKLNSKNWKTKKNKFYKIGSWSCKLQLYIDCDFPLFTCTFNPEGVLSSYFTFNYSMWTSFLNFKKILWEQWNTWVQCLLFFETVKWNSYSFKGSVYKLDKFSFALSKSNLFTWTLTLIFQTKCTQKQIALKNGTSQR